MKLQYKILNKTIPTSVPKYSREGDSAVDLTATSKDERMHYIQYGTNLAIKIPENHVGLLFPRSGISNYGLSLSNSVGIIDENFTGEYTFRFYQHRHVKEYNIGDRIGQLIVIPIEKMEFQEVEELPVTNRGTSAYGSSGK